MRSGYRYAEKVTELSYTEFKQEAQATHIARRMIAHWGMSERLGPDSYRFGEEHAFLGREMTQSRDFSEHTARVIDDEIRNLIDGMEERVEYELKTRRAAPESLANALFEHETVGAREISRLFEKAGAGAGAAEVERSALENSGSRRAIG